MGVLNPLFVQEKLKKERIKIFSVFDFQKIFKVKYETAKKWIFRYEKKGYLIKAKKGLYFLKENPPLDFELANRLYQPSYVSFESALSFYEILPETIYQITSATTKKTKTFQVENLKFFYFKIKKDCFLGYSLKKIRGENVLMAEPEKALADFLYLVSLGKRKLTYERIKLKKIKKTKLLKYAQCFKNKKLLNLIEKIYA